MSLRLGVVLLLLALPAASQQEQAGCSQCHGDQAKRLAGSIHEQVTCEGCHSGYEKVPHPAGLKEPVCAGCHTLEESAYAAGVHGRASERGNQAAPTCDLCHGDVHDVLPIVAPAFRKGVPETCGGCHSEIAKQYLESVHGKAILAGNFDAASCTDCHGEHTIVPPRDPESLVNVRNIRETCGSCHTDVRLARRYQMPLDRIRAFDQSFHGLAAKAGSQSVANCASCHGIHNILPSSDPKSTINPNNLPETCGKCHPGAGSRFAIGQVHFTSRTEPAPLRLVSIAYLFIILATLGYMSLHHLGDFIRKLLWLRLRRRIAGPFPAVLPAPEPALRMHRFERVEHALLIVSFVILVWTGFALRYPDAWWAWPLMRWQTAFPVRGALHRSAAVVMVAVAVAHVVSLIASPRLRKHWKTLWPRRKDVPELILNTAYNLGLRRHKPALSSHSYIEKLEYWAVIWGTAVMALTGFLLWANRYTLQWLPKLWLDVAASIHFYEAVLASLAILVWHFYMVIFDPEVYPMDPAWLHGVSVRRRVRESEGKRTPRRPPQKARSDLR